MEKKQILEAMLSPAWGSQVALELEPKAVATWDPKLVRKPRVLVPVDLQALYVPAGSSERFVQLGYALTSAGEAPLPMAAPFDAGETRVPGVHLHFAPPDALLKGTLENLPSGSANRLKMPALADRWVVIRLIGPLKSTTPHLRGWVIDAATAKVVPLEQYPDGLSTAPSQGRTLTPSELTGTAGGSVNWTGLYDAAKNRFTFHDPLDDLDAVAPAGVHQNLATYVVAGFWSDPALDPLDAAHTSKSLYALINQLRWNLMEDAEGGDELPQKYSSTLKTQNRVGLAGGDRYVTPPSTTAAYGKTYQPAVGAFADRVEAVFPTEPRWPRQTLLHGVIHGVPVRGPAVRDLRPSPKGLELALASDTEELSAVLCSGGLSSDSGERRDLERIVAAFCGQLLPRLGSDDGLVDIEQFEHAAAFYAVPGGDGGSERLRPAGEAGPFGIGRGARAAHSRRRAERKPPKADTGTFETELVWIGSKREAAADTRSSKRPRTARGVLEDKERRADAAKGPSESSVLGDAAKAKARVVRRPAPRFFAPVDPQLAVRGAKRSLRHHGAGRFSPDGLLLCRWPSQVPTAVEGVLDGKRLIGSLPNGAIPPEVLTLVQSALVQDPFLVTWLVEAALRGRNANAKAALTNRLLAEAALRYEDGVYDGGSRAFAPRGKAKDRLFETELADQLRRFSLLGGVDCDPVGVTVWAQPWVPLFLEWEVELTASNRFEGWTLGAVDLEPPESENSELDDPSLSTRSFVGRSPVHTGTAQTLAGAIKQWLDAEEQRDQSGTGEADEETEQALAEVAQAIENLDILSASLDGLRDRLLGLPVGEFGVLRERASDGTLKKPVPIATPELLVRGALAVKRARLVDAFGRVLELPVQTLRTPARETAATEPARLRCRPRLLRPARWMFRLVDPADLSTSSAEATVDQVEPEAAINPVAGFLLPDHIDEALEFFAADGAPLGQLMHEPFGGGVTWEIAPGREGPADAGPLHGLAPAQALLGALAAGLVARDARARQGLPASEDHESALSALLRAVDTTLWTVDSFAGFGNEHIAGLVGRPIAVVRALLRLEIDDDLDELDLSDPALRAARERAFRELADRRFPVRIGELTRADDGLLGFFVDDDYSRFHVVDKAVRDGALESGKNRSHLGELDLVPVVPDERAIIHPYVVADDELFVHPGQVVRLTLLMHPAGKVHLTSGILPRKSLALARDWVHPGLSVIKPSARVGPVLILPGKVRLPKISAFPKDQLWTRRTNPFTWQDDAILAATQAALLPDLPAEVQEGYIRIGTIAGGEEPEEPS